MPIIGRSLGGGAAEEIASQEMHEYPRQTGHAEAEKGTGCMHIFSIVLSVLGGVGFLLCSCAELLDVDPKAMSVWMFLAAVLIMVSRGSFNPDWSSRFCAV